MPRRYEVIEYTKEDLEALDDMPLVDVVQALSEIKRGWIPQGYYGVSNDEFKTYDEDYYDNARLHVAINKAMDIVAQYELLRSEGKIK